MRVRESENEKGGWRKDEGGGEGDVEEERVEWSFHRFFKRGWEKKGVGVVEKNPLKAVNWPNSPQTLGKNLGNTSFLATHSITQCM